MAAGMDEIHHRSGNRRLRGDGATAQVVAKAEAAGYADQVKPARQVGVLVPDHLHPCPGAFEPHGKIAVAIRSGEDDDGSFHVVLMR